MKRTLSILLLCILATGHAYADYSLPGIKERLVILLDLKDVRLDKRGLIFSVDKVERGFKVDRFWMQDRIWSDGICVGIQDSDAKSSATRIREVQLALAKKKESFLIVELVCVTGTTDFIVTYMKLFDPEVEYKRYFPKKTHYDTIKMPFDVQPKDSKEFVTELKKATKAAQQRIEELEDPTEKSTRTKK